MTTEEIQKQIDYIESVSEDDETAHSREDDLRNDFILYVSTLDNPTLAAKAKLVLSTNQINFHRWCA